MSHFEPVLNPTGGAGLGRVDTQPALDTHLMERVVEEENMQRAWQQVKANKGAPGIDRMTIEEGEIWLYANGPALREALLTGTYQPLALRRKAIPKKPTGERLLGIRAPGRGECRGAQEG